MQGNCQSMTTELEYSQQPSFSTIDLAPISSDPDEDWQHLVLEMFRPEAPVPTPKKPRLYLVASTFGEEYDADFAPKPTSATDLPDIKELTSQFILMFLKSGQDADPHHKFKQCAIILFLPIYKGMQASKN